MKKQSDLSRLMGYAENYRYFTYASWVLSAVSALVALVPFVYIWKILWDVLNAAPNYAQAVNIPHGVSCHLTQRSGYERPMFRRTVLHDM